MKGGGRRGHVGGGKGGGGESEKGPNGSEALQICSRAGVLKVSHNRKCNTCS